MLTSSIERVEKDATSTYAEKQLPAQPRQTRVRASNCCRSDGFSTSWNWGRGPVYNQIGAASTDLDEIQPDLNHTVREKI
jgi:hypothetical protein